MLNKIQYKLTTLLLLIFVIACGKSGNNSTFVAVVDDAPDLSNLYVQTFELHKPIDDIRFTNTGGAISSCAIIPELPKGLNLSTSDCTISGTPTVAKRQTKYTIKATNAIGNSSANAYIATKQSKPFISNVAKVFEPTSHINFTLTSSAGVGITACADTNATTLSTIGLSVSKSNDGTACIISGTLTKDESTTTHTITATNDAGTSDNAMVFIRQEIASSLSGVPIVNHVSAQNYIKDTTINPVLLNNTAGSPLTACSASNLVSGLSVALSGDGCEITGAPSAIQAATDATITATNADGSDTVTVNITVRALSFTLSGISDSSVAENIAYTSATPYTSGDTPIGLLSYTLEGADVSQFSVNPIGIVSMVARNFENPSDVGNNNNYVYTLKATDTKGNTASLSAIVIITDIDEKLVFTSGATASSLENTVITGYTATVINAKTAASYNLTGGVDQAKFSIDSNSGVLSFVSAPDYENPTDIDTNNTYVVQISASAGIKTATQTVTVNVVDIITTLNDKTVSGNQGAVIKSTLDTAADLTNYTFVIKTNPSKGVAAITTNTDKAFTYDYSASDKSTSDSFVVTASYLGEEKDATITVNMNLNDPLYQFQWHLKNTGQSAFAQKNGTPGADLNMTQTIKDGFTGKGIKVAVVDTGLEVAHEDLTANMEIEGKSCDFVGSTSFHTVSGCPDSDPTNDIDTNGDHGTSVAGLIGSVGWNGLGGRGVAPNVKLRGFNFLKKQSFLTHSISLGSYSFTSDIDIFNQSYGISPFDDFTVESFIDESYWNGVDNLRSSKGAIYIKSAGNGFNGENCIPKTLDVSCENANMDPESAQVYQIIVGAINANDEISSYSTWGSNVWISAYGGEYGLNVSYHNVGTQYISPYNMPAMITTDQSSCAKGYTTLTEDLSKYGGSSTSKTTPFHDTRSGQEGATHNSNCNYNSTFNGTSAAAPVLSGVVALLLEANSALTWRDVKHILASTATKIDSNKVAITYTGTVSNPIANAPYTAEQGWVTNSAGFHFHNAYGFGKVNVDGAIAMATNSYTNLAPFVKGNWNANTNLNLTIPDYSASGVSNINNVTDSITIEAVQIEVNITHTYTGDLGIEITSPHGTKSILFNIKNGFGFTDDLTDMQLLSNAFYGENSLGNWTIKVVDAGAKDTGTLNSWKIRFYGH